MKDVGKKGATRVITMREIDVQISSRGGESNPNTGNLVNDVNAFGNADNDKSATSSHSFAC